MIRPLVIATSFALAAPSAALVERAPDSHLAAPDAPVVVMFADPVLVDQACRSAAAPVPAGYVIMACTRDDIRAQIMPNPCLFPDEFYASLQCHENAHLSRKGVPGWRH
ncbi:hypothetical protein ACFPIF_15560 [Brevundimonas faecalis]|uniref:hypothetical protein n=1 Tax=Brevundimonas faecalis TaxID=947378 RepID=UPI003618857D